MKTEKTSVLVLSWHLLAGADGAGGLRGGKGFQDMGLALLAELLEHVLIIPCHLA